MTNDIGLAFPKSEIILYADNVVIYFSDRGASIIEKHLKEDINQVDTWCNGNKLIINLNKTKTECVLFGTNQKHQKQKL